MKHGLISKDSSFKVENLQEIMRVLTDPVELSRLVAGASSLDFAQQTLMLGRIVEGARKHQLVKQLLAEFRGLVRSGKLKEDCLAEVTAQSSLIDLLQVVDREVPEEIKFAAMKAIFLYSLKQDLTEHEKILAFELQKICSRMSSGELVVLKATYEIHTGKNLRNYQGGMNLSTSNAIEWLRYVSFQIGHNDTALVELYEDRLTELKLITGRVYADKSGIVGQNFRLTSLGIKICEFIAKGETFIGISESEKVN